jgi:hypothetical protein
VARELARLAGELAALGLDVAAGEANVLWLRAPRIDGGELARRLDAAAVRVAPGGPLGDPERVRLTVPPRPADGGRAVRAIASACASAPSGTGTPSS